MKTFRTQTLERVPHKIRSQKMFVFALFECNVSAFFIMRYCCGLSVQVILKQCCIMYSLHLLTVNLDPKIYTHCCLRNLVGHLVIQSISKARSTIDSLVQTLARCS